MTTIIEIASIRPPKEGKKSATVVDNAGRSFLIWPKDAARLKEGERYEVEVEDLEFNDKKFRKITKAKPAEAAANSNAKTIPIATAVPPDAEITFVSSILTAFIAAGHIKPEAGELSRTTTLLRMLWSSQFGPGLNTFRASEAGQTRN